MKYIVPIILSLGCITTVYAQSSNEMLKKGNDLYKKGDYAAAGSNYQKALTKDPKNDNAKFNLANAQLRQNQTAEAEKNYDEVANETSDKKLRANALYNKGLTLVKEKKLNDAIDAFKQSLRLQPDDEATRENLQKAMNDLKKQNQSQQQNQNKQQPQSTKPKPQPNNGSKMNQQQADQLLNKLRENEKQLQKQNQQQKKSSPNGKDW
ncbi:MAG: tetratricopeptide repeat protein [Filimonas sp.]|nr:tetratricopeptide repeat protein [Filimonas sp.]